MYERKAKSQEPRVQRMKPISACGIALIILTGFGCESTVRQFKVTSFPEGATVYVNGEVRGQTNYNQLAVDFDQEDKLVTLRLEKAGYQTTGTVLSQGSPREMAFFLQEAPNNQKILDVLRSIREVLDRIAVGLRERIEEKKP
jgi:hypothetical protein